jgi:hypothetical protein
MRAENLFRQAICTLCPPLSGESRQALRCERDMAAPRLKLASFGNLRGRTRGKFVIATIARAIMNSSSRKIKELENSHSQYVESAWITFANVLPVGSVDIHLLDGSRVLAACALRHSNVSALVRLITCPTVGILQLGPVSAICSPGFFYVDEAGCCARDASGQAAAIRSCGYRELCRLRSRPSN